MTTMPQRIRTGLKTAGHPRNHNPSGGKRLRKARYKLLCRIECNNDVNTKRPDRIRSNDSKTPWGDYGFTKPGAMK